MGCGCNSGGAAKKYSPPTTYTSQGKQFSTRANSLRFKYVSPGGSTSLYDTPAEVAAAIQANEGGQSTAVDTATGREVDHTP